MQRRSLFFNYNKWILLLLSYFVLLSVVYRPLANGQAQSVILCAKNDEEAKLCQQLQILMSDDRSLDEYGQLKFVVRRRKTPDSEPEPIALKATIGCVRGTNVFNCLDQIQDGRAHLVKLSAEELFGLAASGKYSSFYPVAAGQTVENCGGHDCHKFAKNYAVAVVKLSANIQLMSDLRNERACFGFPGDAAGWNIPMSVLGQNWTGSVIPRNGKTDGALKSPENFIEDSQYELKTKNTNKPDSKNFNNSITSDGPLNNQGNVIEAMSTPKPKRRILPPRAADTTVSCPIDLDIPAEIFTESCVPGNWTLDKELGSTYQDRLCSACPGQTCPSTPLGESHNHTIPLECLVSTNADIAFTSSDAINTYFNAMEGKMQVKVNHPDKYGLLCQNGLTINVFQYQFCNWGIIPEFSYVTTGDDNTTEGAIPPNALGTFISILYQTVKQYKSYYKNLHLTFLGDHDTFALTSLRDLEGIGSKEMSSVDYLQTQGQAFDYALMNSFPSCTTNGKAMRLCVKSYEEYDKCQRMKMAWISVGLPGILECVIGYSETECLQMLKSRLADVAMVAAHRARNSIENGSVLALMAEIQSPENPIYAIAVSPVGGPARNLNDIRNGHLSVCSAGTDSFAGWEAPNWTLKQLKLVESNDCKLTEVWAKLFMKSCVPGAQNVTVTLGRNSSVQIDPAMVETLCDSCSGGPGRCLTPSEATDSSHQVYEQYYGDLGAFKCLLHRKGQLAFFSNSAFDVVDHLKQIGDPDMRNLDVSQFLLLCQDGARSVPFSSDNIASCNLGRMPERWMVVSPVSAKLRRYWQDLWLLAQDRARGDFDWFRTQVSFLPGKTNNQLDLIFSNNTLRLERLALQSTNRNPGRNPESDPFNCKRSGGSKNSPRLHFWYIAAFLTVLNALILSESVL